MSQHSTYALHNLVSILSSLPAVLKYPCGLAPSKPWTHFHTYRVNCVHTLPSLWHDFSLTEPWEVLLNTSAVWKEKCFNTDSSFIASDICLFSDIWVSQLPKCVFKQDFGMLACEFESTQAAPPEWDQNSPPAFILLHPSSEAPLFNSCLASDTSRLQRLWCGSDDVISILRHKRTPRPLVFSIAFPTHGIGSGHKRISHAHVSLRGLAWGESSSNVARSVVGAWKKGLLDSSSHSSAEGGEWEEEEREGCVIMKSSAMNQWGRGEARILRGPLIGDHVFVADRLWNGVLLHGCGAPASHQGDWLVWSCGMFPSGLQ